MRGSLLGLGWAIGLQEDDKRLTRLHPLGVLAPNTPAEVVFLAHMLIQPRFMSLHTDGARGGWPGVR